MFLIFSLYFHNHEKGLVRDFHQLPIHQQNEWNRLDYLKLVAKILFCQMVLVSLRLIHASLSCLHLLEPGKVCKWNGGLHTKQSTSCSYLQLQGCVRCKVVFIAFVNLISAIWTPNNTTTYFWHNKKYLLRTTMIWKMRLAFDVYTSFSQVLWRKAQHDSDFLLLGNAYFQKVIKGSYSNFL